MTTSILPAGQDKKNNAAKRQAKDTGVAGSKTRQTNRQTQDKNRRQRQRQIQRQTRQDGKTKARQRQHHQTRDNQKTKAEAETKSKTRGDKIRKRQ